MTTVALSSLDPIPFDLELLRGQRLAVDPDNRAAIACLVLAIVAEFAGDSATSGHALAGRVEASPGESVALAAERRIRQLRRDAEQSTRNIRGRRSAGDVVCGVLGDEYLLDDYLRIVAVEQHRAFDEPISDVEIEARTQRLRDLAVEAHEYAERAARRLLEDTRLCVCGSNYGTHRGNISREPWALRCRGGCDRFRDVEELPCRAVLRESLPAAAASWAARRGLSLTDQQHGDLVRLLEEMRTADKNRSISLGDAFTAAAAALELSTTSE